MLLAIYISIKQVNVLLETKINKYLKALFIIHYITHTKPFKNISQ